MRKFFKPAVYFPVLVVTIIVTTAGCQREVDSTGFINPGSNNEETVTASVTGTVIDENNQPVAGANVYSGMNTTTTNRYGVFQFRNIRLGRANGFIRVERNGYFNATRSFLTTAGRNHHIRIRLQNKRTSGSFASSTGGTITLSSGAKLVIPASAVTDASGNAYSGTVDIAMVWIDPGSPNLPELVPGDLRGITTGGAEMGLETYGMIGVEMTGAGNMKLKLAAGKTAELTFPVPASMSSTAPATIDLWHFDETTGRWRQEGAATKTGNNYIATVSHFSFWNCDAPMPLVQLCMTLTDASNNLPLNNTQVRIKRPNGSYGYGWTDSSGNLCGMVPKNEALVLQVMDQCNSVVFSQNIGPFTASANLGTIAVSLPPSNSLIITGTVTNCSGANVTNGSVIIYTSGSYYHTVPVTNGSFSLTLVRCNATPINFSVIGIDNANLQQGQPVSGTGTTGSVNVGTIQACGTSSTQFLEAIIDGTLYSFNNPPDNFTCTDSVTNGTPANMQTTSVNAWKSTNSGASGMMSFTFHNNATVGTFPLQWVAISIPSIGFSLPPLNPAATVNITSFGPTAGTFIEGSFTEQVLFGSPPGTPKNVICTFRVRRN